MRRNGWKQKNYRTTAARWNERVPVGAAVLYYPIAGSPHYEETHTRTEAWNLGHGEPVASVEGRTGGVCLSHLETVE